RRAIALTLCLTLWLSLPLGAGAQAEDDQKGAQDPIVRAIVVEGNVEVDTETILNQVQATKVGEPLDIDGLREDVFRIADLGYFESIEPELYTVDEDGVRVVFNIVEFPVVREITITVAENVVEPSRVRALLDVETGKVLNANALTESLQRLPVVSGEQLGYILQATRVELTGSDMDVLAVDVAPVRVGEIIIEGNEKTKEYVIRRELTFKPGDILEMEAIRNSLRRVGQLGYFEPIIPDFLVTDDPLVVDIHLPVTEHKTGRAAFGAGYSSRDGLVGYIEVDDTNFLGRGQQARLKWEFGGRVNMYDLGFTEPYLFGTSTSAGFNLYNRRRLERGEYTLRSTGGEVTFGRPLGQFTRGFLSLRLDNSSGEPVAGSDYEPWSNRTRSIITSLRTDTTDYLNYPTEGFRHSLSVEMAGYFLGGDTRFTKYQTSFSKYHKVGRNDQTVALRVLAGYGV